MEKLKLSLKIIISYLSVYLAIAFVNMELNVSELMRADRITIVVVGTGMILILMIVELIRDVK